MQYSSKENCYRGRFCYKAPGQMGGFTFLGLMMIIAIMGISLLAVGEVWHFAQKREKEQELLFVGDQYRRAFKSYYLHSPAANKQQPYPVNLEDLLKDPRFPSTQRYLRKLYPDPLSGSTEWGLLKNPNGGIFGVYSLSTETPIKQGNFRLADKDFNGKATYADWQFKHIVVQNINPPVGAH
jgi:type II secretory pathway pseudopilin PulG